MKDVLKLLATSVLIPLGLTGAASAADADAGIRKKILESWMTVLVISTKEMDNTKIVKFLEESGLLVEGVSETVKNEGKEKNVSFLASY